MKIVALRSIGSFFYQIKCQPLVPMFKMGCVDFAETRVGQKL